MRKIRRRTSEDDLITFLSDGSHPLKERVGRFLQFAGDRFLCSSVWLLVSPKPGSWTLFLLDAEGRLKVSRKRRGPFDLKKVFKKGPLLSHAPEADPQSREFLRLFPDLPSLALPFTGEGGKLPAALGMAGKEGQAFTQGEVKKALAFVESPLSRTLTCILSVHALARNNRDLVRSGNSRDDHYQMVVHDLKGPISEMLGNLDLLRYSPNLSPDDREVLETALCGCHSLFRMVADLLDINKMEGGKFRLSPRAFSLTELIREKVDAMKVLAAPRGVAFEVRQEGEVPLAMADRELMERVLANLLSNAVAHSYPGHPVTVDTQFLSRRGLVRVGVRNRGEGIPKSYQGRIFKKYGQLYRAGLRKRYSTGLGLTFCKLAVEEHGGRIWVESGETRGSVFYFTIPACLPGRHKN